MADSALARNQDASGKRTKSPVEEFRGQPDGSSGRRRASNNGGGAVIEEEIRSTDSKRSSSQTTTEEEIMTQNNVRPYSLYDVNKKFYTLSEASLRRSQHNDIVKCNSVGKCNSVVEVARNHDGSTAYQEIEKFNRTLESEGVYMRNTSYPNDGIHDTSAMMYGATLPRVGGSTAYNVEDAGSLLYGIAASGSQNGAPPHFSSNGFVVKRVEDGSSAVVSSSSSTTTTLSKTGRIKRGRRTGFMALKVGRFTKNGEKKNSGSSDRPASAAPDGRELVSSCRLPGDGIGADEDSSSAADLKDTSNGGVLPQRANSLDHLNFEQKRSLIASSLSLSEVLTNGTSSRGSGRQSRQIYGGDCDDVDGGEESSNTGGSESKEMTGSSSVEKRIEKYGINLVGMSSIISNSATTAVASAPNGTSSSTAAAASSRTLPVPSTREGAHVVSSLSSSLPYPSHHPPTSTTPSPAFPVARDGGMGNFITPRELYSISSAAGFYSTSVAQ